MKVERGDGWELRWCPCLKSGGVTSWAKAKANPEVVADLHGCLCPEHGLASLESVDHVITDPPYSEDLYARTRTNRTSTRGLRTAYTAGWRTSTALASRKIGAVDAMIEPLADEWARLVSRWLVVFHSDDLEHRYDVALRASGLKFKRRAVWLKTNCMPQINAQCPAQDVEHVTMFHAAGRSRWNGGGKGASIRHPTCQGAQRPDHPSPKPLGVMEHFVGLLTDPGELICDPFAGSGTTGVACIRLGRRFIGWERDPGFFETACKRLANTKEQRQLWDAKPQGKQAGLRCPNDLCDLAFGHNGACKPGHRENGV